MSGGPSEGPAQANIKNEQTIDTDTVAGLLAYPSSLPTALDRLGVKHWAREIFGEGEEAGRGSGEIDAYIRLVLHSPVEASSLSLVKKEQHRVFWEEKRLRKRVEELEGMLESMQTPHSVSPSSSSSHFSSSSLSPSSPPLPSVPLEGVPLILYNYKQAASAGDPAAQYNLGACLHKGFGVKRDVRAACQWYCASALQGYAPAQAALAGRYLRGDNSAGVKKNPTEAARLYMLSAKQGDPHGQEGLAGCYYQGQGGVKKDREEAARLWKLAADQGNAAAQNNLGTCYHLGQGVKKDRNEAIKLWVHSMQQGNTAAKSHLEDVQKADCVTC